MRRLIIGCGYLGKRVAARWLADGDSVAALTRSPENAEGLRSRGIAPVLGDVMQPETLTTLPEVDTVLWAVGWDRSSGISQRDVYVTGLKNILRQVAGRCSRVIYISSTSVYGQSHGEWIDETSACEPAQPNGQACLDAESSLQPWLPGAGTRPIATVMRLSGIYGPDRLLSRAATLKSGEPLAGNPDAWLNLIHVDDAADAVVTCAAVAETRPLFLVSDNEPMPRRAYYSALAELVGAPPPRFAEEEFEATTPARGTRTVGLNKRCNNSLVKDFLQWTPRFLTYREGLEHAVNGKPSA